MIKCKICNKKTSLLFFEAKNPKNSKDYGFSKCKICNLVQINPFPSQTDFQQIYKFKNIQGDFLKNNLLARTFFRFPFSENIFKIYLNMIKINRAKVVYKYKNSGRILDVGFGDGKMLEAFNNKNWQLYGTEINSYLAKKAQKKLKNARLLISKLEKARLPENYFDIISFWHVFEHIENPQEVLDKTQKLLKQNGVLVMEIPSGSSLFLNIFKKHWQQLIVPEHLYFYSEKALSKLLKANNLKIIDTKYCGIFSFSGPSSLANILKLKGLNNNLISAVSILTYPFFIIVNFLSGSHKENMQIVAGKQ